MPVEIIILFRLPPYLLFVASKALFVLFSACEPTRMRAHLRRPAKAFLAVK
jgi:hypothetical protein